jgi:hypothetical protein
VCLLAPWPAGAQVPFPSVVDRIAGVRLQGARVLTGGAPRGTRVEFGDMELFGIAGLRLSGVRAEGYAGGWLLGAEVCRLGAPVGTHTRATLCAGAGAARWRVGVRSGIESLALSGVAGESVVVTALVSGIDVGGVALLADVESLSGSAGRKTSMTVALAGPVAAGARVLASMRYDGPGALAVGAAAIVPLHRALSLLAGYDDGSETARAGAAVTAGRWSLATGVFRHAVLGMSQGVSLSVTW